MLEQYLGNCLGGRGWGFLLLSFIPMYITFLAVGAGCLLAFSDKAVTNFCRSPGAQRIAVWWIVDKINTASVLEAAGTTQVASSLTDSAPGWAPWCYLWLSVICLKEREEGWRESTHQLSHWLPLIFTVLTNGDLLPSPPFRSQENKAVTCMTECLFESGCFALLPPLIGTANWGQDKAKHCTQ